MRTEPSDILPPRRAGRGGAARAISGDAASPAVPRSPRRRTLCLPADQRIFTLALPSITYSQPGAWQQAHRRAVDRGPARPRAVPPEPPLHGPHVSSRSPASPAGPSREAGIAARQPTRAAPHTPPPAALPLTPAAAVVQRSSLRSAGLARRAAKASRLAAQAGACRSCSCVQRVTQERPRCRDLVHYLGDVALRCRRSAHLHLDPPRSCRHCPLRGSSRIAAEPGGAPGCRLSTTVPCPSAPPPQSKVSTPDRPTAGTSGEARIRRQLPGHRRSTRVRALLVLL